MTDAARTTLTYRLERWRAVTNGILETAGTTFLLIVAVRWYHAGAMAKAMVAAGSSVGLLLTPFVVTYVTRRALTPSVAAHRILTVGALAFLVPLAFDWLPLFVLGSVVGMTSVSAVIPLLTHMYQLNYPTEIRGRLFSRTVMIRILTAAVFARMAGEYLSVDLSRYRWLLVVFGMSAAVAAWLLRRCPTTPIRDAGGEHPLRALRFVREDPVFRRTLIAWMLMGFANLMMLPLRVEYLAADRYGLRLPPDQIALYTAVIPNIARLIMSPIWGWVFDRMNFFGLRVVLNLGFMLGILSFFTSQSATGLWVGAVVYGVSNAGGDVAWSLWVTKFAPPERVADYMSVHTAFTGLRGVLAPMTAFLLAGSVSLPMLGWMSAAMILAACLVLLPEMAVGRKAKPSTALVEEVSE
ncbi:MAG: MFS transporter [Verrucomicrobiales bacterium]|nr:MFS transporter [Verrucomicrobiales bacterium]